MSGSARVPQDFKVLQVWQRSHRLAIEIYGATAQCPTQEQFGLTSQMRRCAVSIPANVAEGCGRGGSTELARFIEIARGSASELEEYLLLSTELGLFDRSRVDELVGEVNQVQKMLTALRLKVLS